VVNLYSTELKEILVSESMFKGIIPPVPTIFDSTGSLNKKGMGAMIDHLAGTGVDALFFLGSAGEFSQMSETLRKDVAQFCVHYTRKRKPVLLGTAAPGTDETIMFTRHAKEIGADGVVIINPYYAILREDNIYAHYKRIVESVDIPVILYNFPLLTNQDLSINLIKRLALDFPSIVGIKDTVDTVRHTREIIHAVKPVRPDFAVFAGFDEYLLDTLIMGGDGGFPSSANFAPFLTTGIYRAVKENDGAKIIELQELLSHVPAVFFLESPFYTVVKNAVKLTGVDITTDVLPPAVDLTEEKLVKVTELLKRLDLLP